MIAIVKTPQTKQYALLNKALPFIIGTIAYFLVVGTRALNPENLAWLSRERDLANSYLGWLFFRHSDWTFPIGLNPNYGLEIGNSIVFSDSNPLLAFLFKPFSPWLPETFQYFGIWLLVCFVLQAWFSWKLISLISESQALRVFGTAILVFAPPMIVRLHGHLNLVGHFLIIAALYLYLNSSVLQRKHAWGVLLAATALVHAYFLPLVALIWIADLITKTMKSQLTIKVVAVEFSLVMLFTGIACWQAGYFVVGEGTISGGYGFFRMNLLSVIDPNDFSYILKDIPQAEGDYEGFNYLGLGVIFLLVWAATAMIGGSAGVMQKLKKHNILSALMVCLAVFAASNKIGFGLIGFEYPLPDQIINIANTFRSSGRMFWPVFYLIVFAGIYLVVRGYEKRVAVWLIGFALIIQIADTHAGWSGIRKKLMIEPRSTWDTGLTDPFWESAASKYAKVRWIPPGSQSARWFELAAYAGTHRLATDAVYLARVGDSALKLTQEKAKEALYSGQYEADSLYFLDEGAVRTLAAINLNSKTDLLAKIDDFFVIAPKWKECRDCLPIKSEITLSNLLPPVNFGDRMLTSQTGSGLPYLSGGWSDAEAWGVWSDGEEASIVFPLTGKRPDMIIIELQPMVNPSHPTQDFEITINDQPAAMFSLTAESKGLLEIKIPKSAFDAESFKGMLKIDFYFHNAIRPKDIGINDDTRRLALGLVSMTVR